MDKRLLVIVLTIILVSCLTIAVISINLSNNIRHTMMSITSYYIIDESLQPYINITMMSGHGGGSAENYFEVRNGTVIWIGNDSFTVENIYLVMFVCAETNQYFHSYINVYVKAYPSEPILPSNVTGHMQVIIPYLNSTNPEYIFSLTCNYLIPKYNQTSTS